MQWHSGLGAWHGRFRLEQRDLSHELPLVRPQAVEHDLVVVVRLQQRRALSALVADVLPEFVEPSKLVGRRRSGAA